MKYDHMTSRAGEYVDLVLSFILLSLKSLKKRLAPRNVGRPECKSLRIFP